MKKAEDILDEGLLKLNPNSFIGIFYKVNRKKVLNIIRAMQEDIIRETVKECNNNAEVRVVENALTEEGSTYSSYDDGTFTIFCDEKSILSVADKLIKEL